MPEHSSPHFTPLPAGEGRVRGDLDPVHHIRRDLLDRPVRKYADNLTAQLYAIWKQYEVKTLDDFTRLAQEKKIPEPVVRKYRDLITRLSEVVRSGKFPPDYPVVECKEHTLDLNEVLKASRDFYTSHNLPELADALPDTPDTLTDAQRDRITFALEQGFTSALILPSPDLLQERLDDILEQTANKPSDKLKEEDQYIKKPYFNQDAGEASPHNRPSSSYLLLYSPGSIPEQTKNKTPVTLITLFHNNHWNSLTIPEYLFLQRIEALKRGDHSFDAFSFTPKDSNWTLLLDSRASSGIASADWDPGTQQIGVRWGDLQSANSELGARPSVVVEL